MVVTIGTGSEVVVVTGGSGLVGRAIHDVLLDPQHLGWLRRYTFHFLSSSDCDLLAVQGSETLCHAALKKLKPSVVIHLAAYVGGLYRNLRSNYTFLHKNVCMNDNVIDACVRLEIPRVVACLSTCIFPDGIELPLTIDRLHDGPPHSSNYGYAYAKRLLQLQCLAAREQFGLDYVCVVPTNVFGPYDNFSEKDGHVIPSLIHRCYKAKLVDAQEFVVWGSGTPLRQFIYSHDVARLILWVTEKYNENDPLILTPTDEYSIADVASKIAKFMDFDKPVSFDCSKSDGQHRKTASNAKLMEIHPDFKFTPIDEALRTTCTWFENNYSNARTW